MALNKTLAEMESSLSDSEARKRLTALFDEDTFVELDKFVSADGAVCGVISGYGTIGGDAAYAYAQDVSVKGGAVCKSVAAKIRKVYDLAAKTGAPVVSIFDSKGGDMSEGISLLTAYGDIAQASAKLSGVVPQVAVVCGVCAGASAMTACMADFVIMTEKAELFMTSPFNTVDGKLSGAGTAVNAAKSGVASILVKDDAEAIAAAKRLIAVLPQNNLEVAGNDAFVENTADISADLKGEALVKALADEDSVIELGADFAKAAYTAIGSISWRTVAFVATNKTADKLTAADSAKIAKLVSFADAFSIPVVTIVDTEGFEGSSTAELAGSVRDCSKLAQTYAAATTTKISLITGKAYSSAFVALASTNAGADFTFAWENAVITAMAPEAAAVFLYGDELAGATDAKAKIAELADRYVSENANPFAAAAEGLVDSVIAPENTRAAIASSIDVCTSKRVSTPSKKHINFVF